MARRVRHGLVMASIWMAIAVGASSAADASGPAAIAGLNNFSPLNAVELDELDGMGGNYLDSLPEGVLEQLARLDDLQTLQLGLIDKRQFGNVRLSDNAFQNARGLMAVVQVAGNRNEVDVHLNLNIFIGGTFFGDIHGDWIDLSGLLSGVDTK